MRSASCPRWREIVTICKLIQLLEKHSPDLRVVVNGYEDGYDDLSPEQPGWRYLQKVCKQSGGVPSL